MEQRGVLEGISGMGMICKEHQCNFLVLVPKVGGAINHKDFYAYKFGG